MERIRIDSLDEYKKVIMGKRLYNNGYSMAETQKYIAEGRLYKICCEAAFVLAYDEKRYMQLVIPIIDDVDNLKAIVHSFLETPLVCYVIKDGKKTADEFETLLKRIGFSCHKTIREYALPDITIRTKVASKEYIKYNVIRSSDYQEIVDLWRDNLPYLEIPYISFEDIRQGEQQKQLLFIKDEHDSVVAACGYDKFLGKSTIHHIVVSEEQRGKGYAVDLLNAWLNMADENGIKKARSWIESENTASQRSFEKVGFCMTGTMSYQYIFNKQSGGK